MKAFAIGARPDPRGFRLHGKPGVYVAEPARKQGAVQPMVKYDCAGVGSRVSVKNYLSILRSFRHRFRQVNLGREIRRPKKSQ